MAPLPRKHSVTLVGAGPVGVTLAALLRRRGDRVVSVISRTASSARRAARALGAPLGSADIRDIRPETTLVLIAVPDDAIERLAERLAAVGGLRWNRLTAFHTSGALPSDLLKPLSERGAAAFALHPLQSFPRRRTLREQLALMSGVTYAFEGAPRLRNRARRIARRLGGEMVVVPKKKKNLYHAACVFASNYPVVLLDIVEDLAKAVSPRLGLEAFRPLTASSIEHAAALSPLWALTGPVVRSSGQTLEGHRRALDAHPGGLGELYRLLALRALEMAVRRGDVTGPAERRLRRILRTRS